MTSHTSHKSSQIRRSFLSSIVALAGSAACSLSFVAGTAAILTPVQEASAQFRFGGPGSDSWQTEASITSRSLERYVKVLGLDNDQKAAANALLEGYREAERQNSNAMRDAFKVDVPESSKDGAKGGAPKVERRVVTRSGHGDGQHPGMPDAAAMAKFEETAKARAEKKTQFFSDLKSILTPEQEGNWTKLERLARRDSGLRFTSVSGAGVDLVSTVEKMNLPSDAMAQAQPLLDQYEVEMDTLLTERNKAAMEFKPGEGGPDMGALKAMMDKQHESNLKIRDLNRTYARKIAGVLPAEYQGKLADDFKLASFKKVYRDGRTNKLLANAQKLASLDSAQKDKLARIQEQYAKERRAANDKYAEALEKAENDGMRSGMMSFGPLGTQEPKELADAKAARKELDSKYADQINAVLSDQQKAELPAEPQIAGAATFVVDDGNGQVEHTMEIDPEDMAVDFEDAEGGGAVMIMSATGDGESGVVTHDVQVLPLPVAPAKKPD